MKRHVRIWAVAIILLTGTVCGYGQNTTYIYDHVIYSYNGGGYYYISGVDQLSMPSPRILNEVPYTKKEYVPVKAIGARAFYGCYNIKTIQIPNSVTKTNWACFVNCYRLESVTLPDSLEIIEDNVFYNCI